MMGRCIECGALDMSGKYELHQKRCTFHFLKWAKRQGLTKHHNIDDGVIDNFSIGGDWDRSRENRA